LAQVRTVTPKTRDGMVESLRVLKACRNLQSPRAALPCSSSKIASLARQTNCENRCARLPVCSSSGRLQPGVRTCLIIGI
jgi:hypothetical protein